MGPKARMILRGGGTLVLLAAQNVLGDVPAWVTWVIGGVGILGVIAAGVPWRRIQFNSPVTLRGRQRRAGGILDFVKEDLEKLNQRVPVIASSVEWNGLQSVEPYIELRFGIFNGSVHVVYVDDYPTGRITLFAEPIHGRPEIIQGGSSSRLPHGGQQEVVVRIPISGRAKETIEESQNGVLIGLNNLHLGLHAEGVETPSRLELPTSISTDGPRESGQLEVGTEAVDRQSEAERESVETLRSLYRAHAQDAVSGAERILRELCSEVVKRGRAEYHLGVLVEKYIIATTRESKMELESCLNHQPPQEEVERLLIQVVSRYLEMRFWVKNLGEMPQGEVVFHHTSDYEKWWRDDDRLKHRIREVGARSDIRGFGNFVRGMAWLELPSPPMRLG